MKSYYNFLGLSSNYAISDIDRISLIEKSAFRLPCLFPLMLYDSMFCGIFDVNWQSPRAHDYCSLALMLIFQM